MVAVESFYFVIVIRATGRAGQVEEPLHVPRLGVQRVETTPPRVAVVHIHAEQQQPAGNDGRGDHFVAAAVFTVASDFATEPGVEAPKLSPRNRVQTVDRLPSCHKHPHLSCYRFHMQGTRIRKRRLDPRKIYFPYF